MQLYHFTALKHLPAIMREGITRGEVPIDPSICYEERPNAANLTTNGNRADQIRIWAGGPFDKVKVRISVEVPDDQLISFHQLRERFNIQAKWLKIIAPYEERGHWFYAFDGVKPAQFVSVEVWEGTDYRALSDGEVSDLCQRIDAEAERAVELVTVTSGRSKGAPAIRLKVENGATNSWLLDGDRAFVVNGDGYLCSPAKNGSAS